MAKRKSSKPKTIEAEPPVKLPVSGKHAPACLCNDCLSRALDYVLNDSRSLLPEVGLS